MCSQPFSDVPDDLVDFPLYDFCDRRSSAYVPEFGSMVSEEICLEEKTGSYASALCYGGTPNRSEICALWDSVSDMDSYLDIDKEDFCDSTDDAGNTVLSIIGTVCSEWQEVCSSGSIPIFETMCTSLDSVPDALADFDIPYVCCDVST